MDRFKFFNRLCAQHFIWKSPNLSQNWNNEAVSIMPLNFCPHFLQFWQESNLVCSTKLFLTFFVRNISQDSHATSPKLLSTGQHLHWKMLSKHEGLKFRTFFPAFSRSKRIIRQGKFSILLGMWCFLFGAQRGHFLSSKKTFF